MEILSSFLPLLIFYTIGFLSGYAVNREKVHDLLEETKKHVKRFDRSDIPVGVIRRPTASELLAKTDPHEKKLEEGKEAMRETLESIKDLR
jgi:hypothetical protein